jgi:hypothetical protein
MMDRTRAIAIAVATACGFLLIFHATFGKHYSPPEQPRFVVVDKYEGCDVVRYTNHTDALYHYFLHCKQS